MKAGQRTCKRAIPMMLGSKTFRSKQEATDHVRKILHSAVIGASLQGEELEVIRSLLNNHPDAAIKIGSGVARIETRWNGNAPGFWIIRTDGTETDFSYKNCFASNPEAARRQDFIAAARQAVRPHTEAMQRNFFRDAKNPTCPLLGIPLTQENAHVDHAPPFTFERIVDAFCSLNAINPEMPGHCLSMDGWMIPTFSSVVVHDNFVSFHNANAKLRVISNEANLRDVPQQNKTHYTTEQP